jgi:methylenetetrahydrofolate reductase (NADPH)
LEALAHLTCAAIPDKLFLSNFLTNLYRNGIRNLLPLRGDKPQWMSDEQFQSRYYNHASDLVADIKESFDFGIAGACYPEVHQEAANLKEDIANLKIKVDAGVDFLITQLFYDNETFFHFLDEVRKAGIDVPVLPGLMPITTAGQVKNIVGMSGTKIPKELGDAIEKYKDNPADVKKAGIDYTKKQMEELLKHGVDGIHLYSMNKADVAKAIYE